MSELDISPAVKRTDTGKIDSHRCYKTEDGFQIVVLDHKLYTDDREGAAIAKLYGPDDGAMIEPLAQYREKEDADIEHMVETLAEQRHILYEVRHDL